MNRPIEEWRVRPYPTGALVVWEGMIYQRTTIPYSPVYYSEDSRKWINEAKQEPQKLSPNVWQPLHAAADVEAMRAAQYALETVETFHHLYDSGYSALEQLRARLSDMESAKEQRA